MGTGRAVGIAKGDALIEELSSHRRSARAIIEPGKRNERADVRTLIYTVIGRGFAAFPIGAGCFMLPNFSSLAVSEN